MSDLTVAFASPAEAQSCFRALLTAFGAPGQAVPMGETLIPPSGLSTAAAATLLTLADTTTPISVAAPESVREWIRFHIGAPLVTPDKSSFYFTATRPPLATLQQGSEVAPEASTTLLLDVPTLQSGVRCRIAGPGLPAPLEVRLPLDRAFVVEWQMQQRIFPRGVDVILCAESTLIALPRSLRIEEI
jgi:alpha-D-ribose 1-methylphosphonate 5-triphosphate synthase subunit PhnH